MSEINVLARSQIIVVDPISSTVSVINAGPIGPGGPPGLSGDGAVDAVTVAATGAVMETDTSTALMQFVIDEDTMVSNSATKVPTQQSVRAFVIANAGTGGVTLEQVRDDLVDVLVAGSNITITHDDLADTITIASTGGSGSGFIAQTSAPLDTGLLWLDTDDQTGLSDTGIVDGGNASSTFG